MGQLTSKKLRKSAAGAPKGSYWTTQGIGVLNAPFQAMQASSWFFDRNCRTAGLCAKGEPPPPPMAEFMRPFENSEIYDPSPPQTNFKTSPGDPWELNSDNWEDPFGYEPRRHNAKRKRSMNRDEELIWIRVDYTPENITTKHGKRSDPPIYPPYQREDYQLPPPPPTWVQYPATIFKAYDEMPREKAKNLAEHFPDVLEWMDVYDTHNPMIIPNATVVHALPVSVLATLLANPASEATRVGVLTLPYDGAGTLERCTNIGFDEAYTRLLDEIDIQAAREGGDRDVDLIAELGKYVNAIHDLKGKYFNATVEFKFPRTPMAGREHEVVQICHDLLTQAVLNIQSQPVRWVAPMNETMALLQNHLNSTTANTFRDDMNLTSIMQQTINRAEWDEQSMSVSLGNSYPSVVVAMDLFAVAINLGYSYGRNFTGFDGLPYGFELQPLDRWLRPTAHWPGNQHRWGYRSYYDLFAEQEDRRKAQEQANKPLKLYTDDSYPAEDPERGHSIYYHGWYLRRKSVVEKRPGHRLAYNREMGRHKPFYEGTIDSYTLRPWEKGEFNNTS